MIRKTEEKDIPFVMHVIQEGIAYFKEQGIPQWQNGYPNEETIRQDIRNGTAHVLVHEGKVIGTAAIIDQRDPDYTYIEDGSWLNDEPYIVIHRIAVLPAYKGRTMAVEFLDYAMYLAKEKGIDNLRIDTHEANASMLKFVAKNGFEKCGKVYIGGTAPRIAFQKILKD